jgi:hypothetical protein
VDPDELVAASRQLNHRLAQTGLPVSLGVLGHLPQTQKWYLTLASQAVDKIGPRVAYSKVEKAAKAQHFPLPIEQISVVSPRDPIIRDVGKWVSMPTAGVAVRFGQLTLDDRSYDDVYVFK